MKRYFTKELFDFLAELERNNNKTWFNANRKRYERYVKEPMQTFISDFGLKLKQINKHLEANPRSIGGSMFRIYRDTRFSRDKSPYKTWAAAHFYPREIGNDVHTPGFYLHLEPGNCMGGGGLWHPDAEALAKVRNYIVQRPKDWQIIKAAKIKIEGDRLMRPPKGFEKNHPFIEDLKQKDFYSMIEFSEKEAASPRFMEHYVRVCKKVLPLVEFLNKALNLKW